MRKHVAYSMMVLLALTMTASLGCSDSSDEDQQTEAQWLESIKAAGDSDDDGDDNDDGAGNDGLASSQRNQGNEKNQNGEKRGENLSAEALAERAHQRAINAIRQSSDEPGAGGDAQNHAASGATSNATSNATINATNNTVRNASVSQNQNGRGGDAAQPAGQPTRQPQPLAAQNQQPQQQPSQNQSNNANNVNARPAANGQGRYSVFVEHKLTDPGMNNAHSHTVLVPEGWKVEGGLVRPSVKLYNMPVVIDIKFIAPDGRRAAILPRMSFEFNNQNPGQAGSPTMGGNLYMPLPESAGKWLLDMAQRNPDPTIKDLKLVSEKMEETLTQQLRKQTAPLYQSAQQLNQMSGTTGVGAAYDTQAQVITFTYTKDDKPFEETFLVAWYVNLTTIQGQVSSGLWGITFMVSVRDKPGNDPTKDPMIQTIFQSFRATAAWDNEMNKYWAEINRIRAKGQADRQRQNAKHNEFMRRNNEEISDIIAGGYKNRQAISDRGQQNTVDAIHEVTPYSTPSGEVVRLPSYYNHAYTDGNGRYLLNNDANYNPNLDPTFNSQSWQTINQAK